MSAKSGKVLSTQLFDWPAKTENASVSPPNGTPLDTDTFTAIGTQTATTLAATGAGPYSLQEVFTIVATAPAS